MAEEGAKRWSRSVSAEEEFKEWGSKATFGVVAGMVYGASKEALRTTHLGKVLASMQEGKDQKTKRFMWREMMEQRVIRITRGTVTGGAQLGAFTAFFCGVQSWLAVKRNVHDTLNAVAAGSATAASFGLVLPGSPSARLRAAGLGSLLGAAFCLPLGYLQTSLYRRAEEVYAKERAPIETQNADGIAATIQKLEKSLSDSEAFKRSEQ